MDVYKPTPNTSNNKVYRYDVNSLYPFVMKNFPMPSGNPIYFEGDILKTNLEARSADKPFGIFVRSVEIEAPSHIKIPLLQTRIKVNGSNSAEHNNSYW